MESWSRRSLLGSLAAAPLVGLVAAPWNVALAAVTLNLPAQPMRLVRKLVRELHDGAQIVVEREWLIAFSVQPAGAAINGKQVRADVRAPARVAPIAEIERQRSTDGRFPILLDAAGLIRVAGESTSSEDLAAAVRAAQKMIARQGRSALEAASASRFFAQLQQAGGAALDNLPRDLFFPQMPLRHEIRPVSLPDGSTGEFELDYRAAAAPGAAWLAHAQRRITTRLAGSERHSSEAWLMEPA